MRLFIKNPLMITRWPKVVKFCGNSTFKTSNIVIRRGFSSQTKPGFITVSVSIFWFWPRIINLYWEGPCIALIILIGLKIELTFTDTQWELGSSVRARKFFLRGLFICMFICIYSRVWLTFCWYVKAIWVSYIGAKCGTWKNETQWTWVVTRLHFCILHILLIPFHERMSQVHIGCWLTFILYVLSYKLIHIRWSLIDCNLLNYWVWEVRTQTKKIIK